MRKGGKFVCVRGRQVHEGRVLGEGERECRRGAQREEKTVCHNTQHLRLTVVHPLPPPPPRRLTPTPPHPLSALTCLGFTQ